MTELTESIGHNVRRLREEKGWGQTELAFYAKMSTSIISLLENGKRNPSTNTLARIAEALGVEVADLFPKVVTVGSERTARWNVEALEVMRAVRDGDLTPEEGVEEVERIYATA
jgi:transcriptional regulator with XRE-family HTH domain